MVNMVKRLREFVSLPFLIIGAAMKQRGEDGMAVWPEDSTPWLVNRLRAQLGEMWWQLGIALLGHEPEPDKRLLW